MTGATHLQTYSRDRLIFKEFTGVGRMAIFENLNCPYHSRVVCPCTPDFVLPYKDPEESIDLTGVVDLRPIFHHVCVHIPGRSQKFFHFKWGKSDNAA